jgi:hypothetical protein
MNEVTKQSLLDLLSSAKAHIEAGEHSEAVEKIEEAIATIENEGVAPADGEEGENRNDPPLPGQGTNGAN